MMLPTSLLELWRVHRPQSCGGGLPNTQRFYVCQWGRLPTGAKERYQRFIRLKSPFYMHSTQLPSCQCILLRMQLSFLWAKILPPADIHVYPIQFEEREFFFTKPPRVTTIIYIYIRIDAVIGPSHRCQWSIRNSRYHIDVQSTNLSTDSRKDYGHFLRKPIHRG